MQTPRRVSRGALLIVISSCGFGSLSILTTLVTRAGTPLILAMFWRYLMGAILLIALMRGVEQVRGVALSRALKLLLIGGVGQALITYLSLRALDYIPVGPLAFLFYTYPAWVALISAARGVDRMTWVRGIALVLALLGVGVMIGSPFARPLNSVGVALALASALAYGFYLPLVNSVQRGVPPNVSTLYIIVGAMVTFLLASLMGGSITQRLSGATWANILLMAIVSTVVAFRALLGGLAVLGPVRTAIIATIEPFFTALLGALLLGEPLTVETLMGGALIAAAVVMIQRNSARGALDASPEASGG